ncbi:immunodominant staphylococcal antigen IsaB family protein [Staphylococcus sp. mip270_02]|uniref:immunodominant staphylococcal antigen IsaB family protein n=1 Tax=Staphylococcus xylosus TaxID=1288 RepID=UPI003D15F63A
MLAVGITLSTLLGATTTQFASQSNVAKATVKLRYNYSNKIGYNANFILDSNFKNVVKHNNIKINGYNIYTVTRVL